VATIEISALGGHGLEALKDELFARAEEGNEWYPTEFYTDQEPDFRITELIREQVMNRTREEIPHSAYVEIADLDLRLPDGTVIGPDSQYDVSAAWDLPVSQRPRLNIRAFICVERDTQKGIVVGKGGELIRVIREQSELGIRELFPYFITLDLRVKVAPKWRNDDKLIERIIH
jgi:GTP-binding protein Era